MVQEKGGRNLKNKYINQLPEEIKTNIYSDVRGALYEEGLRGVELQESIEAAMESKLYDLEDTIDITKYTSGNI